MAQAGFALLVIAFIAALVSVAGLVAGRLSAPWAKLAGQAGRVGVGATFLALLACCLILVVCFMTGDVSILYVLQERSLSTDGLAWLYKLSGLWAGRAGSLLFWTTLIALFNVVILGRYCRELAVGYYTHVKKNPQAVFTGESAEAAARLDDFAMMVVSVVVAVFCGLLLFSEGNMPFTPTPAEYFAADGSLITGASYLSMNMLLEHWAMAIHPPLLFVGYAGLTVPFAYALAALAANDPSELWVERSQRFALTSWLFLGAGIGLGAAWAYGVLGWGGYWGWDPVENASLLPWLVCAALVHTFAAYRQRGAFKRWAVMCACLAFTFVVVATFITRSGIVDSVHAFAGDPVSLALFGGLIVVSLVVPVVGLALRWKSFGPDVDGADDIENTLSKEAAYYFNNVIMLLFAFLLTYMTLAPALPTWLPFGGSSFAATAFEAVARPLGILYLLILAVCPLLAWSKTDPGKLLRQARVPAVCALVLFVVLAWWWATQLVPVYDEMLAVQLHDLETGAADTSPLLEAGPSWYYNGLAVIGLLVASLLFFNALLMLVRGLRAPRKRGAAIGGAFAHTAMAVILVGLIGSNMYVLEKNDFLPVQDGARFSIAEYDLVRAGEEMANEFYRVDFDVYKDGVFAGQVHPTMERDVLTGQTKRDAAVLGSPEEDLFVVFYGLDYSGDYIIGARVNPFISLVWVGFAMLMIGTLIATVMPRRNVRVGGTAGSAQKLALDKKNLEGDELRSLRFAPSPPNPTFSSVEEVSVKGPIAAGSLRGGENSDAATAAVDEGGAPSCHPKPPSCHPEPPSCHPERSEGSPRSGQPEECSE